MNNNSTRLSTRLNVLLHEIENSQKPISIGHMIEVTGSKGFGILILLLSMPSALPMPVPIFSIPFGLAIACLLIQMLFGRKTPWLPKKVNDTTISISAAKSMLKSGIKILNKVEHLIHPRWTWFCYNKFAYIILFILTCVLILPFPLTNTAPALILFLFSVGLIENDGIICLIAFLIGILLTGFYCVIAYYIFTLGFKATITLIKSFY
ncbi:MAG: hypothetical protein C5B43_02965 [Verrucomicrobia bacterium]|nr:MAG: hypothetical protein C5B43_02965 [Verrucomicrobiota bacterium]